MRLLFFSVWSRSLTPGFFYVIRKELKRKEFPVTKHPKRPRAHTLAELKKANYVPQTVKAEMRRNLIAKIRKNEDLFPGIIGYEETVIPQFENAILSGQDVIFLGERGQAKSRMIRGMINLLDEEIPALAGCEINDSPYHPICKSCQEKLRTLEDRVEIAWLGREKRYGEKLATPDVTIADLIGEVDPIKVAEGRYLSDELTIHYGLIPRTNRGIFAINELPDLSEKIQVGLFNIMEERDVQIRGYKIRLPLDVYIVASANPEDYTNRGRIITPLKDRYGSEIRTHYPKTLEAEIRIMDRECTRFDDDGEFHDPDPPLPQRNRRGNIRPGAKVDGDQPALRGFGPGFDLQLRKCAQQRPAPLHPVGGKGSGSPDQRPSLLGRLHRRENRIRIPGRRPRREHHPEADFQSRPEHL